jgi:hypothetical protein
MEGPLPGDGTVAILTWAGLGLVGVELFSGSGCDADSELSGETDESGLFAAEPFEEAEAAETED